MNRDYIDVAANAQIDRRERLLRDVIRSGGIDNWSHLHSHGHRFPTVKSAVLSGYLTETRAYHYEVTDAGRWYIDSLAVASQKCGGENA
jgi:hypothetical protein